jgi:hypothetical protein
MDGLQRSREPKLAFGWALFLLMHASRLHPH